MNSSRKNLIEIGNDDCFKNELPLINNVVFQIFQLLHLIFCILGVVLIIYFINSKLLIFAGHNNIKIILYGYFLSIAISCVCMAISRIYSIFMAWTYTDPCTLGFSPLANRVLFSIYTGSLFCVCLIQLSLAIERTVATVYSRNYESFHNTLGLLLLGSTVIISIIYVLIFIPGSIFTKYVTSGLMTPPGNATTYGFILGCITGILSLGTMPVLMKINRRKTFKIEDSLSGKYQRSENIRTTKFVIVFVGWHCVFQLIYCVTQLLLLGIQDQNSLTFWRTVTMVSPMIATLLPLIAFHECKHLRVQSHRETQKVLAIPAAGDVYIQMLHKQWMM